MRTRLAIISAVIFLFAAVPAVLAQQPFSADLKMAMGESMQMDGKVFFSGQKIRMEMKMPQGESVTIADPAKQTTYMLMPAQKMYMEMNAAMMQRRRTPELKQFDMNNPCANAPNLTCKKIGTDTVHGRTCDKWEFTNSGHVSTFWLDQKLHFPIKVVTENSSMELVNIKEGPQGADLFRVPPDYQKMDMGGMMGGPGRPE